ncbi:MAG: hypothetical protein QXJ51_00060 [Sulfolobales archaeon]
MKSFIGYKLLQVLRDPLSIVLLIVFLYMLIFLYIPLAVSVGEILLGGGVNTGIIANSLPILVRSVLIALISSALCLLIAIPISYLLSFYTKPLEKNMFIVLILAPYWVGSLLKIYALAYLILVLESIAGTRILYTETSLYIGLIYNYSPLAIIPIFLSMERIDRTHIETSRSLGAGALYTLFRVILPISSPGITSAFFLVFAGVVGEVVVPQILMGASNYMVGQWIYQLTFSFHRLSDASLLSMLYLILTLALLVLIVRRGGTGGFTI